MGGKGWEASELYGWWAAKVLWAGRVLESLSPPRSESVDVVRRRWILVSGPAGWTGSVFWVESGWRLDPGVGAWSDGDSGCCVVKPSAV